MVPLQRCEFVHLKKIGSLFQRIFTQDFSRFYYAIASGL